MRTPSRSLLSATIALALAAPGAFAQDSDKPETIKPGLYTTVDEHSVYIIKGDEQVDVQSGESVFVSPDETQFIQRTPDFLDWPCGTAYAGDRGAVQGYSIDDLPPGNRVAEIVRRWFEDKQILRPEAEFSNGEFNGRFSMAEIDPYVSQARWYHRGPENSKLKLQRPETLIVALFRGTGQVIVDTNFLDQLIEKHGDDIPVVVQYQDENVVPVSYFGENPSIQDVMDAWAERGIRLAEVPMWYGGDRQLDVSATELAQLVNAPPLDEITPARRAQLEQDLRENGFTQKPATLTLVSGTRGVIADESERIRVAQSMGIDDIPVMFNYFNDLSAADHCGLAPPVAEVGALGETSADQPGPLLPEKPPEIQLPNPPEPEQPVSGS